MPSKTVDIPDIGTVTIVKRRQSRNVRISLDQDGAIRVSIPLWTPYKTGIDYTIAKKAWILHHKVTVKPLRQLLKIGKSHTLRFYRSEKWTITTRIIDHEIRVMVPQGVGISDSAVQLAAKKACIRALKKEAGAVLPKRLSSLANKYNFYYTSVAIKPLKTRWGSCSNKREIKLNCYLMQLDWELIDYVLVHELMHTRVMAHDSNFWTGVEEYLPNYKQLRKKLRTHRTSLQFYA